MEQPPRSPSEHLVSLHHLFDSLAQGIVIMLTVAAFYLWALAAGTMTEEARTLAFIALVTANAALILPSRSPLLEWRQSYAALSPVAAWVLGGTLLGLALITSIPALSHAFSFQPVSVHLSLLALGIGIGSVLLFDAAKIVLCKPRREEH